MIGGLRTFTANSRAPGLPNSTRHLRQSATASPRPASTTSTSGSAAWPRSRCRSAACWARPSISCSRHQLENLQNGDRFYYLSRTAGLQLRHRAREELVRQAGDAQHRRDASAGRDLPTPTLILEVDPTKQFTGLGVDGRADPTGGITINGVEVTPAGHPRQSRHGRPGYELSAVHRRRHVVLGGTAGNDILIAGDRRRHALWRWRQRPPRGRLRQRHVLGGDGDDIIPDMGGDDNIQGGAGNDVIQAGNMIAAGLGNIILGGDGKDFIVTREDISTIFGGAGRRLHSRRQDQPAADRQRRRRLDRVGHAGRRARRQLRIRSWPTTLSATTSSSAAAASTR